MSIPSNQPFDVGEQFFITGESPLIIYEVTAKLGNDLYDVKNMETNEIVTGVSLNDDTIRKLRGGNKFRINNRKSKKYRKKNHKKSRRRQKNQK